MHAARHALRRSGRVAAVQTRCALSRRSQHSQAEQQRSSSSSRSDSIPTAPPAGRELLKELEKIKVNPHIEPQTMSDRTAQALVSGIVGMVEMTFPRNLLRQAAMMETLGPVPGMVGTFTHRIRSAITRKPCKWATPTMGEARREFVHFRAMLNAANAGFLGRFLALGQHGMWAVMYLPFYLLAPRTAHRFNGYLEEAAVKKYTQIIEAIDAGHIRNVSAPPVAMRAWNLAPDATLRDVVLLIRADEADFREVHHHITDLLSSPRTREAPKACDEFHIDLSPAGSRDLHLSDPDTSRVHVSGTSFASAAAAAGSSGGINHHSSRQDLQSSLSQMTGSSSSRSSGSSTDVNQSMREALNPAAVKKGNPQDFKTDENKSQKVAGDSIDLQGRAGEPENPANQGAKEAEESGQLPNIKSVQTNSSVFASPINASHQAGEPAVKRQQTPEEKANNNFPPSRAQTDKSKHQQRQHARAFCSLCVRTLLAPSSSAAATANTPGLGEVVVNVPKHRQSSAEHAPYEEYIQQGKIPKPTRMPGEREEGLDDFAVQARIAENLTRGGEFNMVKASQEVQQEAEARDIQNKKLANE